jgi:hypothetical protein
MKWFLIVSLMTYSLLSFSKDPLRGKLFFSCDTSEKGIHEKYLVEYLPNNEEFETTMFSEPSKKKCLGKKMLSVSRIWKYVINGNELITTLKFEKFIIFDPKLVPIFNKIKQCNLSNWKLDEVVTCTGNNIIDPEMIEGHRTSHTFTLKGDYFNIKGSDSERLTLERINHR